MYSHLPASPLDQNVCQSMLNIQSMLTLARMSTPTDPRRSSKSCEGQLEEPLAGYRLYALEDLERLRLSELRSAWGTSCVKRHNRRSRCRSGSLVQETPFRASLSCVTRRGASALE